MLLETVSPGVNLRTRSTAIVAGGFALLCLWKKITRDKTRDKTRQDKTRHAKPRQDKRPAKTRDETRQDARHDTTDKRQDKRQETTRETGQDKTRPLKARQDEAQPLESWNGPLRNLPRGTRPCSLRNLLRGTKSPRNFKRKPFLNILGVAVLRGT